MTDRRGLSDAAIRAALTPDISVELLESADMAIVGGIRDMRQDRSWLPDLDGLALTVHPAARPAFLIAVLLLLLASLIVAVLVARPQRPQPVDDGLLAFGSDRVGLFVVDDRASDVRPLLGPWDVSSEPNDRDDLVAWSLDGTRLAYIEAPFSGWSIGLIDARSGDVLAAIQPDDRTVYPEWGIQWSVDGRRLILSATRNGLPAVASIEVATGRVSPISPPDTKAKDPAVAPIGDAVAFLRTSGLFDDDWRLVVTSSSGRQEREVMQALASGARVVAAPGWSPDGRSLIVTVQDAAGLQALARVGVDGAGARVISPWTAEAVTGAWSPDGSAVLVSLTPRAGREQTTSLYLVEPDGAGWRQLTSSACSGARWTPSGKGVVFQARVCEDPRLVVELRVISPVTGRDRTLWVGDPRDSSRLSFSWQPVPRPR